MESIDSAAVKLEELITSVGGLGSTIRSEQDTRFKVIDPMFCQVLGWSKLDISTEEPSGGGFLDYKFSISDRGRLIVEAKKDSRALGLNLQASARPFKLNGPVFKNAAATDGIQQAIRYCGQKNTELACVTNGREWIVFRGSRVGDGQDTITGVGFVFTSLQSVQEHFSLFYGLLSYEAISQFRYRAIFQEAEHKPIRAHHFRKSVVDPRTKRLLPPNRLHDDLDRVMVSFFRRLSGENDPDFMTDCFVVSKESQEADRQLARISEDLRNRIQAIDTDSGDRLTHLIERVRSTQRNEFVLLVGTKGAGKSTFIDRFFRKILPSHLRDECIIARVNLADSAGSEQQITEWLDQRLVDSLENTLYPGGGPTFDELQGLFFDEYQRLSNGPWNPVYSNDKHQFKIDFGRHVEKRREERPHEYIQRLVHDIAANRKKVPCLIFDNADHFTIGFQERVFQYARSIYENAICLVIMPITDRTSWQLSQEGALRSFENETLFLPTPQPGTVLKKRIEFLEKKLGEGKPDRGDGYFLERNISLSISNLRAFCATLQALFINDGQVSRWVGDLANNDIRRCLEIAQAIVGSPYINASELITVYLTRSSIDVPKWKTMRAIIRQNYNIYPGDVNRFFWNIFSLNNENIDSPLTGVRILQLLEDSRQSDEENPFVSMNHLLEYNKSMLIEDSTSLLWIRYLLDAGLCWSYDPTVTEIGSVDRIEISPSGYRHLEWSKGSWEYQESMMLVTPLRERDLFEYMLELHRRPSWDHYADMRQKFIEYLIAEDAIFCQVPINLQAFESQRNLAETLRRQTRVMQKPELRSPNRQSSTRSTKSRKKQTARPDRRIEN